MRYMGSKGRHAKHLIPLMSEHFDSGRYIEPFLGGGNMMCQVDHPSRFGSDVDEHAVGLLKALSEGYVPPKNLTEGEYYEIKNNQNDYPTELVGFAKYSCSFGGKAWGGFCRGKNSKGEPRNYALEQHNHLLKQAKGLVGARFSVCSYLEQDYPKNSLVYMDPPYANTTKYSTQFNHQEFWSFCDDLSKSCKVFVSEYSAPEGWTPVWEKTVTSSLTRDTGAKKATEKLFTTP